jgi:hypothetical protein
MSRINPRLEDLIGRLSPELQQEVEDFAEFLLEKHVPEPKRKYLRLNWEGALEELRDRYTSVELQHKTLDWWDE